MVVLTLTLLWPSYLWPFFYKFSELEGSVKSMKHLNLRGWLWYSLRQHIYQPWQGQALFKSSKDFLGYLKKNFVINSPKISSKLFQKCLWKSLQKSLETGSKKFCLFCVENFKMVLKDSNTRVRQAYMSMVQHPAGFVDI